MVQPAEGADAREHRRGGGDEVEVGEHRRGVDGQRTEATQRGDQPGAGVRPLPRQQARHRADERDHHEHGAEQHELVGRAERVLRELGDRLRGEADHRVADGEERRGRGGEQARHQVPDAERRPHREHADHRGDRSREARRRPLDALPDHPVHPTTVDAEKAARPQPDRPSPIRQLFGISTRSMTNTVAFEVGMLPHSTLAVLPWPSVMVGASAVPPMVRLPPASSVVWPAATRPLAS